MKVIPVWRQTNTPKSVTFVQSCLFVCLFCLKKRIAFHRSLCRRCFTINVMNNFYFFNFLTLDTRLINSILGEFSHSRYCQLYCGKYTQLNWPTCCYWGKLITTISSLESFHSDCFVKQRGLQKFPLFVHKKEKTVAF